MEARNKFQRGRCWFSSRPGPLDLGFRTVEIRFPKQQQQKKKKAQTGAKQLSKVMGKGDYKQVMKDIGAAMRPVAKEAIMSAGAALGGVAGSRLGSASGGAKVGRTLAARLSKMFGCGDYVVNESPVSNSLLKGGGNAYATFGNNGQSTRIQHREFLFDLSQGSVAGAFTNVAIPINPGLLASFPYLAPIAANFEEYRINGLVFEYISTTSPYLAGGAMGSVVLSMQYNPLAPPFTSKVQMENSDFAISARPDQSMVYGVECAMNTQNLYFVRQGASAAPLSSTDLGLMQFAIQSPIAINTVIGEIWVSYDIELLRPKAQTAGQGWAHFSGVGGAAGTSTALSTTQSANGALTGLTYSNGGAGVYTIQLPSLPAATAIMVTVLGRYAGATAAQGGLSATATNSTTALSLGNGVIVDGSSSVTSNPVGTSTLNQTFLITGSSLLTVSTGVNPVGATTSTVDVIINLIAYGVTAAQI